MSDRELLEMAGKAAGIAGMYRREHQPYGDYWMEGIDTGAKVWWNPLVDDSDALRLAVACEISFGIGLNTDLLRVSWWLGGDLHALDAPEPSKMQAHNLAEWLRRAIVRAAAEIGSRMP